MSHDSSISPPSVNLALMNPMLPPPHSYRRHQRRQNPCGSYQHVLVFLVLCYRSMNPYNGFVNAFAPSSPSWKPQRVFVKTHPTRALMSSVADAPSARTYPSDSDPSSSSSSSNKGIRKGKTSSNTSSFQSRMKGLVKRRQRSGGNGPPRRGAVGGPGSLKPENLVLVNSLGEYKDVIDRAEAEDKMVVVRFYATWCKACKAIEPSFYRMANRYPDLYFVEVPVTNENVNLHQGLGVPSLPYGHVYYPNAGLVEELKISRKYFAAFEKRVEWYDNGECSLDECDGDVKKKIIKVNGRI